MQRFKELSKRWCINSLSLWQYGVFDTPHGITTVEILARLAVAWATISQIHLSDTERSTWYNVFQDVLPTNRLKMED
jgi:hypothetical protein